MDTFLICVGISLTTSGWWMGSALWRTNFDGEDEWWVLLLVHAIACTLFTSGVLILTGV